jgi:hypothetical protein
LESTGGDALNELEAVSYATLSGAQNGSYTGDREHGQKRFAGVKAVGVWMMVVEDGRGLRPDLAQSYYSRTSCLDHPVRLPLVPHHADFPCRSGVDSVLELIFGCETSSTAMSTFLCRYHCLLF